MYLKLTAGLGIIFYLFKKFTKISSFIAVLFFIIYGNRIYRILLFSSVAIPGYFRYKKERKKENPDYNKIHLLYAAKTAKVVSTLEGIYYKVAQVFGSRLDITPIEYQRSLQPFLDNVKTKSWRKIKKNCKYKSVQINKRAIAGGSIGQIHTGVFKGKKVVIKLLYPQIEKKTKSDLWALKLWIKKALPGIKPQIDSFSDAILTEFDFRKEALVLQKMYQHFKEHPKLKVIVPKVMAKPTRVSLLMEYMEGMPLLKYLNNNLSQAEPMITLVFQVCIEQMVNLRCFTTDPHPGNFLVSPQGELILLDFGQHNYLRPERAKLLIQLWDLLAETNQNNELIKSKLQQMGYQSKNSNSIFFKYFADSLFNTSTNSHDEASIKEFNQEMSSDTFTKTPSDLTLVTQGHLNSTWIVIFVQFKSFVYCKNSKKIS